MILASFHFGPYDGKRLVLPCDAPPWPRFVIPKFGSVIDMEFFYLLCGELEPGLWSYIFDDSYAGIGLSE